MVSGIYVIGGYIRIGKVSFETIPFRIFLQFLVIDGHFHIPFHFQELVVSALVDIVFGKRTSVVCLLQAAYPFLPVISILSGTVFCISD